MSFNILTNQIKFPHPSEADEHGLLAIGGDLSPKRLLHAYSKGIFPWYSEGQPILWFSPDPRMILIPPKFKCSNSLKRVIQSEKFELKIDTQFESVIRACASVPRAGQPGTWITKDMINAYIELHERGWAHSFETYQDSKLVGGLYGISIGAAFFGESMYHTATDASKFAFFSLVSYSLRHDFHFIDAQTPTKHLKSLGAENIARDHFLTELQNATQQKSLTGSWSQL